MCRHRNLPNGSDHVLVALTGWGQAKGRRRALEAEFDQHFVKPIEIRAIERLPAMSTKSH
jgi:CheY-like chemotaxis protein